MTLPSSGNPISFSQVDVELGYSATAQRSMNETADRTLFGLASVAIEMNTGHGKSNTSVPGAPTGVSASASSSSAISVSFSAPACTGNLTIDTYQVVCTSSGSNSATGASSPISVTGLSASTSYTFKVRAHNSKGYGCYSSTASATTSAVRGCAVYCTQGTYSWTAPAGVTSVSVVAVEGAPNGCYATQLCYVYCSYNNSRRMSYYGGCGGRGGGMAWRNSISVTPGQSYQIIVGGATGSSLSGFNINCSCCSRKVRAMYGSDARGTVYTWGGAKSSPAHYWALYWPGDGYYKYASAGSGGGAGGYSRAGTGYNCITYPITGGQRGCHNCACRNPNGIGGAGAAGNIIANYGKLKYGSGGGGGVGLYGQGSNGQFQGCVGTNGKPIDSCVYNATGSQGGGGGSNGASGGNGLASGTGGNGGNYGGGAGGGGCIGYGGTGIPGVGGKGAVRIVWPGNTRTFPSTDVGTP